MVLFLFPLVGHFGWLQGGGQRPLAAGCAFSNGGGAGSGRHLAAAGDFTASAVILLNLALVRLTFSEANRIHSTSLAENFIYPLFVLKACNYTGVRYSNVIWYYF